MGRIAEELVFIGEEKNHTNYNQVGSTWILIFTSLFQTTQFISGIDFRIVRFYEKIIPTFFPTYFYLECKWFLKDPNWKKNENKSLKINRQIFDFKTSTSRYILILTGNGNEKLLSKFPKSWKEKREILKNVYNLIL